MTQRPKPPLAVLCPEDSSELRFEGADARCPQCDRRYPLERGVLRLLDRGDAFYEGTYHNHVAFTPRGEAPWHAWPLWLINSGYPWSVRRHVPAGSVILELGCAGGVRYFGERYQMVGCDLSSSSLESLEGTYRSLVQADVTRGLPFASRSADAIVSASFWEHLSAAHKAGLARECARVLRPAGKLVFLYDVETDNPLICRYRRRRPDLYQQLFLEADGHVGYEAPADNLRSFTAAGLRVLEHRGLEKTPLQPASVYTKLAAFGGRRAGLFRWAERLGRRPLFYPYTALLRALDMAVAPWLPERWARIALVVCEAPA